MKHTSFFSQIVQDIIAFLILSITAGFGFLTAFQTSRYFHFSSSITHAFSYPLLFLIFLVGWIIANGVIYWIFIHWILKEGSFVLGVNAATITWYLEFALRRFISYAPFGPFIHGFRVIRSLFYASFGCHVPLSVNFSADISIQSPRFFTIGEGSLIGSHSIISPRMISEGKLVYRKVTIGKNVNLSMFCNISPGVNIGDDTYIGAAFDAYPLVQIGSNCHIEEEVRIESGARIGNNVRIGKHSVIEERAKVPDGTIIPARSVWSRTPHA